MRPLLALVVLAACQSEPAHQQKRHGGAEFLQDDGVRITSPANGDTVESDFVVTFEAGADVRGVRLDADGATVAGPMPEGDSGASFAVALHDGKHDLELVGLDRAGERVSHHAITVRVASDDAAWVTIVSPSDGASVPNPVTFVVDASQDVPEVTLVADGWPIGTAEPGGTLSYVFTGTGYERQIVAEAIVGGEVVATDAISLTVEEGSSPPASNFNDIVTDIAGTYDGSHEYYWPDDSDWPGTTQDIWYLDTLVAEGDPEGRCYCVGLTWEVYMRAFQEADRETGGDGSLNGLVVDDLYSFRTDWFVRDLYGSGVVDAMDNYGLGDRATNFEDLRPGDFVQFWRHSGSGHSVVFMDWERDDDDAIDGLYYWACSSDGIGYGAEYFGTGGSSIDPAYTFVARGRMPADWSPWE